ncbi:MAG: CapA family protein [Anaerobutyricum sp.]
MKKTSVINDVQKTIAHYAVKKGANLVLGHHPYTLQGIEKIQRCIYRLQSC